MRRVLFVAVMLLAVAVACKDRAPEVVEPPVLEFEVENKELTISYEAQDVKIAVVSNQDIACDIDAEWLVLLGIEKEDDYVVVVRAEANAKRVEREAEIVLRAGDEVRIVKVRQLGMPEIMQVTIDHRNVHLESPEWGGEGVGGSVDWGDGLMQEYADGISHNYADNESHTAVFTMSGATSFRIDRIGDMDGLTIAVD